MSEAKRNLNLDPADPEVDAWWDEREAQWQEQQFQDWLAEEHFRDCQETRRLWRQNGWKAI